MSVRRDFLRMNALRGLEVKVKMDPAPFCYPNSKGRSERHYMFCSGEVRLPGLFRKSKMILEIKAYSTCLCAHLWTRDIAQQLSTFLYV